MMIQQPHRSSHIARRTERRDEALAERRCERVGVAVLKRARKERPVYVDEDWRMTDVSVDGKQQVRRGDLRHRSRFIMKTWTFRA